jgi:multiple sugar transport system substrate-binding protein/alpha-glucoside transport system substrate-binding protein
MALAVAGCGSSKKDENANSQSPTPDTTTSTLDLSGQTLEVAGVWSGAEQANMQKVLDAFSQKTGAKVTFTSTGDEIATVLGTRIQGGNVPDVALLPQPGLLAQFAKDGSIKPVSAEVEAAVDANYAADWKKLGSADGKLYGVWFKAANKSTVWYNTALFDSAGVQPPKTWDEFMSAAKTLSDSGVPAVSVGGADGWTLTDWFENVYLRSAGGDMYDKLTNHEIPWTDPSVTKALQALAQLWSQNNLMAGGSSGALQTDFPTSVSQVWADSPKAAMVYEGDFVAGVIGDSTKAKVGTDAKFFDFPSVDGSGPSVVGGGDVAVAMKDSPGAMALLAYLASPEAAEIWAKIGGFTSPNKNVDLASYPDDTTREVAKGLTSAETFRFDMSDLAPSAFGGTKGAGEWKALQDFLRNPSNIEGTQKQLEADAAAAYK